MLARFTIQDFFIAICKKYNGMLTPHSLLQYSSKHKFYNNSKELLMVPNKYSKKYSSNLDSSLSNINKIEKNK